MSLATLLRRVVTTNHGFLAPADVAELAKLDRLRMVLVRCGNGRFTCPAQDAQHFIDIICRDFRHAYDQAAAQPAHAESANIAAICNGADYIRDVSLPAQDDAHNGQYHPHTFEGGYQPSRPKPATTPTRSGFPRETYVGNFRAEDCGGTFDGFGVVSDADPGL